MNMLLFFQQTYVTSIHTPKFIAITAIYSLKFEKHCGFKVYLSTLKPTFTFDMNCSSEYNNI